MIDRLESTTTPAKSSTSSSSIIASPTLVWVTQTLAQVPIVATVTVNGVPVVTQTVSASVTVSQAPYTQSFSPFPTAMQAPMSGSIGLGKWASQGTVGTVKSSQYVTLTHK